MYLSLLFGQVEKGYKILIMNRLGKFFSFNFILSLGVRWDTDWTEATDFFLDFLNFI